MNKQNSYVEPNKQWWGKMVKEECGFTKPWLNLDPAIVKKLAKSQLKNIPEPLNEIYPVSVLTDVKDKDVLCLAAGGGQQSAVFGILGARVTVVDIADGQLKGDKKAADHYGYKVRTIQSDMSDLSLLADKSFDLVYQAPSMGYVPDIKRVYSEVVRILRAGGIYRADALNPLSQFVDHESSWNGKGYCITVPYEIKEKKRSENENVIEYRHYLDEIFNGLIECGLIIEHVEEMPRGIFQTEQDKPGTWGHLLRYLPGIFAILARKK